MKVHHWGESKDGSIEFVSLSKSTLEGSMNVFRQSYFVDDNMCRSVELTKHPGACDELEELFLEGARDGLSLIAIEKHTKMVVGALYTRVQVKSEYPADYYKQYAAKCQFESTRCLVECMQIIDATVDIFEITKADCVMESMFCAVLPEYRNRGIARKLMETVICLAKALNAGQNVKVPIDNTILPLKPIPTVVHCVNTSSTTQRFTTDMGFKKVAEIRYENFYFEEKSFASCIGPKTPCITIAVIPILVKDKTVNGNL